VNYTTCYSKIYIYLVHTISTANGCNNHVRTVCACKFLLSFFMKLGKANHEAAQSNLPEHELAGPNLTDI